MIQDDLLMRDNEESNQDKKKNVTWSAPGAKLAKRNLLSIQSFFLPTYNHLFYDYNSDDVLLVSQPQSIHKLLSIKMMSDTNERRVNCTHTPSIGDVLTRVIDGGYTYGCIIAPFDPTFVLNLRQMAYKGVIIAYDQDAPVSDVLLSGYNGVIRGMNRETMKEIVKMFEAILCMKPMTLAEQNCALRKSM